MIYYLIHTHDKWAVVFYDFVNAGHLLPFGFLFLTTGLLLRYLHSVKVGI